LKWAALAFLVAGILPLSAWLRRNPNEIPKVCILVGFLPWDPVHLYMAPIGFPLWPGHVAGFEISLLDGLALALYLALPAPHTPLPFRFAMALYFVATLISVFQASVPPAALFYVWQLARMFLVYAALTKACADPRVPIALIKGMAIGLIFEAGYVIFQRFGLGIIQPSGSLSAQNFLGLMSHFAVFPIFALLLVGRQGWLISLGALAGVVVELFTISRATLGIAVFCYVTLFLISALRRWTSRKSRIMVLGLAASTLAVPFAVMSFQTRFALLEHQAWYSPNQEVDERIQFENVAARMLADHPFGVGPNHYVISANHDGYNAEEHIPLTHNDLLALVHNVYWLVADESGYLGVITFIFFLLQPLMVAFRCGWRHRGDIRGDLLLGFGVSLLAVYIHSLYEWILISFQCQYMLAINMAIVVSLARQLGYWRGRPKVIPAGALSDSGFGMRGSAKTNR
jgi:hypothetical protein